MTLHPPDRPRQTPFCSVSDFPSECSLLATDRSLCISASGTTVTGSCLRSSELRTLTGGRLDALLVCILIPRNFRSTLIAGGLLATHLKSASLQSSRSNGSALEVPL